MKAANVLSTDGVDRATVEITSDDGSTYKVENLGPLPIFDTTALWFALSAYDAAYVAGKQQEQPPPDPPHVGPVPDPPVMGVLTPPKV